MIVETTKSGTNHLLDLEASFTVGSFGLLDGANPGRQIELSLRLND